MREIAYRVMRRFIGAETPKKKRMILMMGPPAAGKGFFLGEPEKVKDKDGKETDEIKKYKGTDGKERETRFGWKLPQMLVNEKDEPLLTEDDLPERPEQDESDNHLRAVQFNESKKHFEALKKAHEEGPEAFKKALSDHWYDTKDGETVKLGSFVKHDDFPDNHHDFFKKVNKDFYVSMRGWQDDAKQKNKETGKPKERFKDEARHRFDDAVELKIQKADDFLIIDSAGEDIDAQDYKGQIESAKANGYEVSVIFLHPEQADTELSNLSRGKVMGKRMVDQSDIDNWYKRNAQALEDIQSGEPDNFIHYRKGPPDSDPKKAAEKRAQARDLMNKLSEITDEDEKKKAKKEIAHTLYEASPYKMQKETSFGVSKNLPKKPPKSIADVVKKQNADAEKRADDYPEARVKPKKKEEGETEKKPSKPKEDDDKPQGKKKEDEESKTRMDFLHDVGDKKVPNPNPKSRSRFPQIKVRSLPWENQKKYYEQWSAKQAALAIRVASRYMEKIVMADEKSWLADWMEKVATHIKSELQVKGYKVETKATKGPVVYVTVKGAEGDTTAARETRPKIEKLLKDAIKEELKAYEGFSQKVSSFNKGDDLVFECTIIFP